MPTTSLTPNHPDELPIWARLSLITQEVPFEDVKTWNFEAPARIVAFLNTDRHVFLYRH